jgi:hypothetical protein
MAQIEVVAHLRHQADAPVKQGGSGEGRGESGSAHVPGHAMRRPVRREARVADQHQVSRARESVPAARLSGTLFPVPHLAFSPGVHNV